VRWPPGPGCGGGRARSPRTRISVCQQGVGGEEIAGQQGARLGTEELGPGAGSAFGGRVVTGLSEHFPRRSKRRSRCPTRAVRRGFVATANADSVSPGAARALGSSERWVVGLGP
jgi:hypothetical protein